MPMLKTVHIYISSNSIRSFHYTTELFNSSKTHLGFPKRKASIPYENPVTAKFHNNKKLRPIPGEKSCLMTTRLYINRFSCTNMQMSNYVISN